MKIFAIISITFILTFALTRHMYDVPEQPCEPQMPPTVIVKMPQKEFTRTMAVITKQEANSEAIYIDHSSTVTEQRPDQDQPSKDFINLFLLFHCDFGDTNHPITDIQDANCRVIAASTDNTKLYDEKIHCNFDMVRGYKVSKYDIESNPELRDGEVYLLEGKAK